MTACREMPNSGRIKVLAELSGEPVRVFSYLPNPRVWKALIAAEYSGAEIEVVGAKSSELKNWLWDFDARELQADEYTLDNPYARQARRGFGGTLFKTDDFLSAHPFGTVPAAFSDDGKIGVFESNSILRAAARAGDNRDLIYPESDSYLASRIDSFLDADLIFSREWQVYLLGMSNMTTELYERMKAAYEFYLDGVNQALENNEYLVGDRLTIADIGLVCGLAQFLRERKMAEALTVLDLPPITENVQTDFPNAYGHLMKLSHEPTFFKYLEKIVKDLKAA